MQEQIDKNTLIQSPSYLGIDISKEKIDICLLFKGKSYYKVYTNNKDGHEKLTKYLTNKAVNPHVCMEATGRYHLGVATYLYNKDFKISIANPFKIKSFKNTKLLRNKTDSYDANVIAEYCRMYNPRNWVPDNKKRIELRSLYRVQDYYKKELVRQNNQLESFTGSDELLQIKKDTITHIESQIKKIDELIKKFISSNEEIKKQHDLLITIPGIASTTATALLAELPELSNFKTARELAAHIGVTPQHNISGKSTNKRSSISKIGNGILRKIQYFPSVTATVFNKNLSNFAQKLKNKGKAKMVAIIAVMRKMVHIIYRVLKSGEEYKEVIQVNNSTI